MKLMIVESAGKIKKLQEILAVIQPNETWRVEASIGHIRDLPKTGQGPDEITTGIRNDFTPIYELTERGREIVAKLKRSVAQASEVYLATDPDREGESISWHLKDALELKNPLRIAFNEITESKLREVLAAPRRIDIQRVRAQEARRSLDRLVGYLVSPELRRQTGESLSAGRVQSVAVLLVVQRERQIAAFKPTSHFGVRLFFAGAKIGEEWFADWMTEEGFTSEDQPYFLDRDYAELVASVRQVMALSFDETESLRNPPAPFKTTTLQQAGNNALGFDPDVTMKLAQALYEAGHITYHRTDNPNISDDSMPALHAAAQKLGLAVVESRRKFSTNEDAQEGHPGITPTHWDVEDAGNSPEERDLYKLIRVRAIASQLTAARYKVRTLILEGIEAVNGKLVRFQAKGRTLVHPGWMQLLSSDSADDPSDNNPEAENPIPCFGPGERAFASKGEVVSKKTKAPARFTQASLTRALEAQGIGRPSTYAEIWKNISSRNYVGMHDKRFIKPMPAGELIIERLENQFGFLDVGFTRAMESELDGIESGTQTYDAVLQKMYSMLAADLEKQRASVARFKKVEELFPCPTCGKPLRFIAKGANGPFWGCTGYPKCSVSLPDAKGTPSKRKKAEQSEFLCQQCEKPLIHRQKTGKGKYDFWGCSGFSAGCKATYKNVDGKPDYSNSQ